MSKNYSAPELSWLDRARQDMAPHLRRVLLYGVLCNVLALAPSVYMLQVYDRVINSGNLNTLAMLTVLIVGLYAWMECLEAVRHGWAGRAAAQAQALLAPRVFDAAFQSRLAPLSGASQSAFADLASLRGFLVSPALLALLDAPFAVVVMLILFVLHPWLGLASVVVALVLAVQGWVTDRGTRLPLQEAGRLAQMAQHFAGQLLGQMPSIQAMGMRTALYAQWDQRNQAFLRAQMQASDSAGQGSAVSRLLQVVQGSFLLGLGSWLTLTGGLPPGGGAMLLGSVLGGRALAPLTQLLMQWRTLLQARAAYTRLDALLGPARATQPALELPPPRGVLQVQGVGFRAAPSGAELLRGVQFQLVPGQVLAVLGPSGAGKSTLARVLVGLVPASEGTIRLDGVDIFQWDKAALGPHLGYLPQGVDLLDGSFVQNIARFREPDMPQVRAAASAVGLLEFIEGLPQGFDTPLGVDGQFLSGGVRQRVGLARALYGQPRLLVLDEPNAHLDEAGDALLQAALSNAKTGGASLILVTHRPQILAIADQIMVLREGRMQACGPRDEVLRAIHQAMAQAHTAAGGA